MGPFLSTRIQNRSTSDAAVSATTPIVVHALLQYFAGSLACLEALTRKTFAQTPHVTSGESADNVIPRLTMLQGIEQHVPPPLFFKRDG